MSQAQEVLLRALEQIDHTTESWGAEAKLESAVVVYYVTGDDGYSALSHVDSGMAKWQAAAMLDEVARRLRVESDKEREL